MTDFSKPLVTVPKRIPTAFTGMDFRKLLAVCDRIRDTQLGSMMDAFTADELRMLFVPWEHRQPLTHVYGMEDNDSARGEIYVSYNAVCEPRLDLFEGEPVGCAFMQGWVKLTFHRQWMPDGFITPTTLFGTSNRPVIRMQDAPEELTIRFKDSMNQLLYISAEWAMIKWVLDQLQNSLRSPEQVRYVWPAIATLSKLAELEMDLSRPSPRAGMNAKPSQNSVLFLRPTNELVAHSTLLGVKDELIKLWTTGGRYQLQATYNLAGFGNISV